MMLVIESSERTKFSVLLIDNPTTVCETFNRSINRLRGPAAAALSPAQSLTPDSAC
jgi:hypothetical protein